MRRAQIRAPGQTRRIQTMNRVADDGADDEGKRRPHVEILDRKTDEQGSHQRPYDRADPSQAQLPSRSVGAQRRRVDQRTGHVEAGLNAQDAEAGEECCGQQCGLGGQSCKADRADQRDGDHEHDRYGEKTVPLEPPAQHQRPHCAADLQHGAGESRRRRRELGGGEQRGGPAEKKEVAHQVEGEQQPQQRSNKREPVAEEIGRIETRKLRLALDHEPGVGRHFEVRPDRRDELFHLAALAFADRHELDRFRQAEHRGDGDHDRRDAADHEQDRPAVFRHQHSGHDPRDGAADRHAAHSNDRKRRPELARRGLGVDRDHVRNNAADPEPGKQP